MAIEFVCPTCNSLLQVGDEAAGRVIRCGGCQTMLRVPETGPAPAGASAPPPAPTSPFETGSPSPSPRSRQSNSPNGNEPVPVEPRRRRREPGEPYDDRPRRRRSRREPPPESSGGRGVFFWLAVLGALMFFAVVGCCGGIYLLLPNAEWHEHKSKDGGFRVELPGPMRENVERPVGLHIDDEAKSEGASTKRGTVFVVLYRDHKDDKKPRETDEQLIEKAIQNIQKAVGADTANSKEVKVGELVGREVEFPRGRNRGKGWFLARVVVADSRVYIVLAGGGFTKPGDADVRRFLDSFQVTDEELLKRAKKELPVAPPPRLIE